MQALAKTREEDDLALGPEWLGSAGVHGEQPSIAYKLQVFAAEDVDVVKASDKAEGTKI